MSLRLWSAMGLTVLAFACLSQYLAVEAQQRPEAPVLRLDTPISRTLSGKQEHFYRVLLSRGEAIRIELEQRGVDVAMTATVGEGKDFASVNLRKSDQGLEPLYLITETGTEVRVKVFGASPRGGAGQYSIKLAMRHDATEDDRQLFKAQALSAEASRLVAQGDIAAKKQAWTLYDQSLLIWQNQKENAWRSATLIEMGNIALELNNFQEARDFFSRAATLGFNLEDVALENFARQGLCRIHHALGERLDEIKCLDRVSPFLKKTEDKPSYAQLLMTKARAARTEKQNDIAIKAAQEAIPLLTELGEKSTEAEAYELLGQIFSDLQDRGKAITAFTQAVLLRRELNENKAEATLLNRIGLLHLALGEFSDAREAFVRTLKLAQFLSDNTLQASVQHHLGELWAAEGNTEKALESYREARRLATFYANQEAEGRTQLGFARTSLALNQTADVAPALVRAGELLRLQGDRLGETTVAILQARLGLMTNDAAGARQAAQLAYRLGRQIGHYPSEHEALLLGARAARALGDNEAALKDSEAALALSESARGKAFEAEALSPKMRRSDYELYLDLLMRENERKLQAGYNDLAFQLNERMRASSLLESLTQARVDFGAWADPDLLRREKELVATLRKLESERVRRLQERQSAAQLAGLGQEIDRLSAQYQATQKDLFANHPRYTSLARPKLLNLAEVQALLDDDTTLIEYALGAESSTAWVVNKNSIKSVTLTAGATIETLAQRVVEASATNGKNADDLLRELSNLIIAPVLPPAPAAPAPPAVQKKGTATARNNPAASVPAAAGFSGRLLIVPDGALHLVPFAALYEDKTRTLSTRREIAYLPSASLLPLLQQPPAISRAAGRDLAVVSDPVLLPTDTRIPSAARANAKENLPLALKEMSADAGQAALLKRSLARRQTRIGWEFLNKEITFKAFDFNASRNNLIAGHYNEFYAVHFDIPALINTQHLERTGLVFSLLNADGDSVPGFVSLSDLYQLNLNTHLVTLPAVRTSVDKAVRSDALIGLTRGFMYAGVRNVVTSLWEVDSQATAEFMRVFYDNLLDGKLKPPAALRAAQAVMRKNPRWHAPHYWAGFVVQGTWR